MIQERTLVSFYEVFLVVSYFTTFVYHILIYHFFYVSGFIKENYILFSKEAVIFLYKIQFSGIREIGLWYGSITHGWESVL